jgi:outer membrane murein-binding lipoprotein Lpp
MGKQAMPIHKLIIAAVAVAVLVLTGCNVQKSKEQGGNEKVDIRTPVGGIKVNTEADAQDVGLAVYPGATLKPKGEGEHSSANVNISSSLFGVKVVALKYLSNDPPDKIKDFYKKELGKYGDVLDCKGGVKEDGDRISCGQGEHKDHTELVVGTKERQHIVSIKPDGKGTEFSLVYVQTRGKDGAL